MTGKLILTSISTPIEGMKVVYETRNGWTVIDTIKKIDKSETWLSGGNEWVDLVFDVSELRQIAVEYDNMYVPSTNIKDRLQILPLHPDDYERAVGLIGQECNFDVFEITICRHGDGFHRVGLQTFAKLSLPTQEERK
jgi:hypothetical protein